MKKNTHSDYKKELETRLKKVKKAIEKLESVVYVHGVVKDDAWFKAYRKLNFLRVDRRTISSRIDNVNRPSTSTIEVQTPINY